MIEVIPSTKTMMARRTGSIYRAISAEAGTKHGYLPSLVIYDELAQAKNRDLYDVLDTSFGARDEPLFITISTQSNDPEHILSKLIDDGLSKADPAIVCHLYAADEDCALDDEAQWLKANPALGNFRDHEDLATAIRKAMRMPAEEPKVRNLFLNQRVSPMLAADLARRMDGLRWRRSSSPMARKSIWRSICRACVDLTALVMGSADRSDARAAVLLEAAEHLREHSDRDFGSGNHALRRMARRRPPESQPRQEHRPGSDRAVHRRADAALSRRGLAYDRWRIDDLLREFDRIGLQAYKDGEKGRRPAAGAVGPRLQGYGAGDRRARAGGHRAQADPSQQSGAELEHGNAIATMDPAGNRKLDKDKARFRIDGAVALAMLLGLRSRDRRRSRSISRR